MQEQQEQTPFTPADVRRALGDTADARQLEITSCCVLFDLGSEEYESYAVAEHGGGGREVIVRGVPVFLLPPNAPLSAPLRDCRPGDLLDGMAGSAFCYQVVSRDGSPILSESERQRFLRAFQATRAAELTGTPP
jgi:hypothetical protein